MRTLVALVTLGTLISGCQTGPSSGCPREVEYSPEQQKQAAVELQTLPSNSLIRGTFMPDYGRLRDQARACRGAKP